VLSLAALLVLWCLVIAGRLTQLQIVDYGDFTQRASRQQRRTIDVSPRRGVIYDRNGHELAMTISVDSVFAVPSDMPDLAMAAGLLGRVLGVPANEMLAKLDTSKNFVWVARKLDAPKADRIRALNLKGIYFQKETKRFYPKRELAAQVLGYVGLDDEGLGGIEKKFDDQLRGKAGKMFVSVDARQKSLGRVERAPEPGDNLVLTIDEKLQYIAERELDRAIAETRAAAGTVVIQNPKTGEILALASRPTFNPNAFHETSPQALKNRAVSDIYEPGSTFKIVTVAGALEERLTKPEEIIDCQMGSITVGGLRIRDHKKYGMLSVEQIIANSSDVGAIKLGLRLGERKFDQYIRAFGFGSQTGIELPGETRGLTKPVQKWSKVSIGAISMGQEIGISAVQLGGLISTIANGGVYVPPRILMTHSGPVDTKTAQVPGTFVPAAFHPGEEKRVISSNTAAQMKRMLQAVVQSGTGPKAQLQGYSSAGKTGTAQKVDPNTGAYSKTKYVASFAGFAPINDPAVVIVVILDSAVGLHQGGQIAAPVFSRIAQQVLPYLNVPHDLDLAPAKTHTLRAAINDADLEESSPDRIEGSAMAADASVEAQLAGSEPAVPHLTPALQQKSGSLGLGGEVVRTSASVSRRNDDFTPARPQSTKPASSTPLQPPPSAVAPPVNGTVVLELGGGTVVPSFLGKPLRAVVEEAQQQGLEVDAVGSGVAREQAPVAGSRVPAGAHVAIRFGR